MGSLFFSLKILLVTIAIVAISQIKIGENTLENQAYTAIQNSFFMEPISDVAKGGVALVRDSYRGIVKTIDGLVSKTFSSENTPGNRAITKIKRSDSYEEQNKKENSHQEETW